MEANEAQQQALLKLAGLEARVGGLEDKAKETTATLTKLIWGLLGLIAALVGKESAVAALGGHTPVMAYVNFGMACFAVGGLAFWGAANVFLAERCNTLGLLAAVMLFIVAGVRIDMGLHGLTDRGVAVIAGFFLIGVIFVAAEEVLLWAESHWHFGQSRQGKPFLA